MQRGAGSLFNLELMQNAPASSRSASRTLGSLGKFGNVVALMRLEDRFAQVLLIKIFSGLSGESPR
jgi:hypothetical protein